MTTTRDVVRSGAFAPLEVQTYGQIPNVLDLPNLIKIQLDSFEWFKREGLRELLTEISPIQDFTGQPYDRQLSSPANPGYAVVDERTRLALGRRPARVPGRP